MRAAVVVLAAGAGTRVGADVNKVLLPVGGVPVVARSVRTACSVPGVRRVVLVVRDGEQDAVSERGRAAPLDAGPEVAMVTGGETRHASEWAALELLAPAIEAGDIDVVAMHDAARPLASAALYEAVLATAERLGGAIPVARLDDLSTLDGSALPAALVGVQTPQAFRAADLLAAHRAAAAAGFEATDTAGCLAAYADVVIGAVESDAGNLKVTVADDLRSRRRSAPGERLEPCQVREAVHARRRDRCRDQLHPVIEAAATPAPSAGRRRASRPGSRPRSPEGRAGRRRGAGPRGRWCGPTTGPSGPRPAP